MKDVTRPHSKVMLIWLAASLFYAWQYVLRVMPNVMMQDILERFHVDAFLFGQYSGVYYIGYALMHIPVGIMLDWIGPRKVMTGAILLCIIGTLPLLFAEHWIYPVLGRVVIGMGSSAAILGTFKILRMVFSEKKFSRMLGFSVTIGLLGAIYAGGPLAFLNEKFGFQSVLSLCLFLGLGIAVLTWLVVPDTEDVHQGSIWLDLKEVLSNRRIMFICLFAGCMVGPLEGFADVWGSVFLREYYGLSKDLAAYVSSLIFVGMCFGAPLLSIIAEKNGRYLPVITWAGFLMLLMFLGLLSGKLSLTMMMGAFLLTGICSAYQVIALSEISTCVQERMTGLVTAIGNMIIMSFGYAFHTIIGTIVDMSGGVQESSALVNGVSAIPIGLLIGVLGFCYLLQGRTPKK